MPDIPIFDWIRWVEIPMWLAVAGLLVKHAVRDHIIEVEIMKKLEAVDDLQEQITGLDRRQDMVIRKMIGAPDDFNAR